MTHTHRRLRAIASRVLDEQTMERLVEPALTDIDVEYADAVRDGCLWRRRWVWIRGHAAFLTMLLLYAAEWTANIPRELTDDDRRTLVRVSVIGTIVAVFVTIMLTWVPLHAMQTYMLRSHSRPHADLRLLLATLIPQALPIAIAVGVLFGVLGGRDATKRSWRSSVSIVAGAILLSVASFVTLAWVAPVANQAFRVAVAGQQIRRGDNELMLGEMRRIVWGIDEPPMNVSRDRRLAMAYYTRWAFASMPMALTFFALAWTRRYHRRGLLVTLGIAAIAGSSLMWSSARELAISGSLPAAIAAWVPSLMLTMIAGATVAVGILRANRAAVTMHQ